MNSSMPPNKKPRLDCFDEWDDAAFGNDDLWGQGDLTAEEFDMLEVQATQKVVPGPSSKPPVTVNCLNSSNMVAANNEEIRKEQYALQGKIKLLSESLDKTVRELNLERINRQQLISEKLEHSKDVEKKLKKEIEKMQTALHFKDQEMKMSQSKVQALEHKVKELNNSRDALIQQQQQQQQPSSSMQKNSDKFLSRFNFEKQSHVMKDSSVQACEKTDDLLKYKLPLLSSKGIPKNCDIVSNFLINRRYPKPLKLRGTSQEPFRDISTETPYVAFASFNSGNMTLMLKKYYSNVFREHILFLQRVSKLDQGIQSHVLAKIKLPLNKQYSSSVFVQQQSTLGDEIEKQHSIVTTCMKDLHQLCLPFDSKTSSSCAQQKNMQVLKWLAEPELNACSSALFPEEEKADSSEASSCLQSLLSLSKPESYPDIYIYKQDEMHLALSVLLDWSSKMNKGLEMFLFGLPFESLVSGSSGTKCALIALKLLLSLIPLQSFKSIVHQNDTCIFTSLASLSHTISSSDKNEYVEVVAAIKSFVGECTSVCGMSLLIDENCQCSSQLIQGLIVMLWRYHDMCLKAGYSSSSEVDILQRGVVLLHLLATSICGFREKRSPVEDQYIALVCGLHKCIGDESLFKNISDSVNELWDFQDVSDDADE